jgi:hypothetical protein
MSDEQNAAVEEPENTPIPDEEGLEAEEESAEMPEGDEPSEKNADYWRGRAEAAEALVARRETQVADEPGRDFDAEIAETRQQLEAVQPDPMDDEDEKMDKRLQRVELRQQLSALRAERQDAQEAVEGQTAAVEAHKDYLNDALKAEGIPPSRYNALDQRVRARLAKAGRSENEPPSRAEYETAVEVETLRIKNEMLQKKGPTTKGAQPPKPSTGGGPAANLPDEEVKFKDLDEWAKQMRAAGF